MIAPSSAKNSHATGTNSRRCNPSITITSYRWSGSLFNTCDTPCTHACGSFAETRCKSTFVGLVYRILFNQAWSDSKVITFDARFAHHVVDCPLPNSMIVLSLKDLWERKEILGYVYHGNGVPVLVTDRPRMLLRKWPVFQLNINGVRKAVPARRTTSDTGLGE